ncbi:MAG: ARPP-1 family domain-containing protein [Planctomycetota bacterium]|jgi:hypothetical protein
MKEVKFFALLALVLLGVLAVMYACTSDAGAGGTAIARGTDTGTQQTGTQTDAPANVDNQANTNTPTDMNTDAGWKPGVAPSVTTGDLKVSGPYAHKNLEIYLVHGQDQVKPKREILTLEEALEQKKAVVHETSNVSQLAVENLSPDTDIYVQSGDIVQGGKQDRVLAVDLVLSPKSGKVPIASFCVEQGRWGARGISSAFMQTLGTTSFQASSNALSSLELKRAVKVSKAQSAVWQNVATAQKKLSDNVGADVRSDVSQSSLELTLEGKAVQDATKGYVDALVKIIDDKNDVLGFAVAVNGKIASADVYGSNALFGKLWNKLLNASAVEAVAEHKDGQKFAPVGTDKVTAFLADRDDKKARSKNLTGRVQLVQSEGASNYFFETRDRANGTAWLHRNYLRK